MTFEEFFSKVNSSLPKDKELPNPGGGTSKIISVTRVNITYQRGQSRISIPVDVLYDVYEILRYNCVIDRSTKIPAQSLRSETWRASMQLHLFLHGDEGDRHCSEN